MISLQNILIKYGDRILLDHINLVIRPKEKIGLIGRNGCGKSTLLKIISGEVGPHAGQIDIPGTSSIGFLQQYLPDNTDRSVRDEARSAFDDILALEQESKGIEEYITTTDPSEADYEKKLTRLGELQERLMYLDVSKMDANIEKILIGLGFKSSELDQPTGTFSGGWRMRIELAKLLLSSPDYLLLDEPTNHLDILSIIWLENYLQNYPGTVITVSHDAAFLDNVTDRTVEIVLGKVHDYKAPYSKYIQLKEERKAITNSAYKNQQKQIAQKERTIKRFMAKATKTKMAQSMQKQLDKVERIEIEDEDTSVMNLNFREVPRSGDVVIHLNDLAKSYGAKEVFSNVNQSIERAEKIALLGQNGQGKTTLMKLIVGDLDPSNGNVKMGYNVDLGYYAQNQSDTLDESRTVLQTIEAVATGENITKIRSVLGAFLFSREDVDKKVSVLSGGEKSRLALACLMMKPINFLVLDEPTNHLDMISKNILKDAINSYNGALLLVSHDREFLSGLTQKVWECSEGSIIEYLGDVNYFLEKKALQDLRELDKSSGSQGFKKDSGQKESKDLRDKRKKLERNVQYLERDIGKLEGEIKSLESEMAKTDFYGSENEGDVIKKYDKVKSDLAQKYVDWEKAIEALEDLV